VSHSLVCVFVREKKNKSGTVSLQIIDQSRTVSFQIKKNKSGTVSLQIIDKSSGCYRVARTAGFFSDPGIRDEHIKTLFDKGLSS